VHSVKKRNGIATFALARYSERRYSTLFFPWLVHTTSPTLISLNMQPFHIITRYTSCHHPLYMSSSTKPSIYVFNRFSVANSIYLWVAHHKIPAVEIHVGSIILEWFTLNKITCFHI
jgi:hypothetical protein